MRANGRTTKKRAHCLYIKHFLYAPEQFLTLSLTHDIHLFLALLYKGNHIFCCYSAPFIGIHIQILNHSFWCIPPKSRYTTVTNSRFLYGLYLYISLCIYMYLHSPKNFQYFTFSSSRILQKM